jgi:hypothetical protein
LRFAVDFAQAWDAKLTVVHASTWLVGADDVDGMLPDNLRTRLLDLRRAETGRYLAQFREPPVVDAWQRLSAAWEAVERRQTVLLERMAGLSGTELEAVARNYRHFVLDTDEEYRLGGDIEAVRGFVERLGVCIRVGNCDPSVAQAQLGPALWRFRNQHYDYFALEGMAVEVDRVVSMIAPQEPHRAPRPLALN